MVVAPNAGLAASPYARAFKSNSEKRQRLRRTVGNVYRAPEGNNVTAGIWFHRSVETLGLFASILRSFRTTIA
jgi:hypothetical protein